MPIPLPHGSPAIALCRPEECKGCDARHGERDPQVARLALSPLLREGMAMAALRAAWLPMAGDQALNRLDDQQLLDAIGGALASGQLLLCRGLADAASDAETKVEADGERQAIAPPVAASSPPPPAAARAAAPPPPAAPAAPAPAPAAEPEIDAAAMTAVLLAAARDGVPFCEECEKARRAREAAAA